MLKAIEYLGDFFTFVITLFKTLGEIVISLVTVLGKCVTFLTGIIGALPPLFTVSCGVLIVVCVLYKVLGREGKG